MPPCVLFYKYRRYGGACCFHLQGGWRKVKVSRCIKIQYRRRHYPQELTLFQHLCDGPKYTSGSAGSQETFLCACRMMWLAQLLRVRAAAFRMAQLRSAGRTASWWAVRAGWNRTEVAETLRTDLRSFVITLVTAFTMVLWLLWLPLLPWLQHYQCWVQKFS